MSSPAPVQARDTQPLKQNTQPLDLAALGQTWTPPQVVDTAPEVSDVLAEMPWWAARGLLYLIVGFLATAFIWAYFSQVDVIVETRGVLTPEGYTRPVQAVGGGVVQYLFVREGDTVGREQPLLQLDASEMHTRVSRLREELQTSQEQLRQLRALKGPAAETLDQANRLARLHSELAAAEANLRQTLILAPVAGVLTTLNVRGAGSVLQPGQNLAAIAPAGARLLVEAQAPNKDIALLEKGLPVKLKFDAFPFQDYGVMAGTVVEVAPDAQTSQTANQTANQTAGSFYKVMIAPAQTSISARGKNIPLRPGLTLTAEVVTERKSILNLLLEPFRKLQGGGLK